jgi:hypothetical protein
MFIAFVSRLRRLLLPIVLALPMLASAQPAAKPFNTEQLDQMLAQVALYPDSLLSQLMMAATYPDEFQEAAAWSKAHPDVKGDAAVAQVESREWDPSVASLVAFPEVLITLGDKPDYVKNLGDAFLAQPEDVMDSVQRLRAAAQKAGNLASNEQIKVSSQAAPAKAAAAPTTVVVVQQAAPPPQVIVIEPAQPSVVYVPAYNPAVVYGAWWYPTYPPYYYPPPPGYWFSRTVATGIAFGVGIGITNALWGGFNWGGNNVNINVNRYNNINVNNRLDVNANRTSWNHDPGHRKADYRGGGTQRQSLERKSQAAGREAYRGKDAGGNGSRDASRDRAQQAMAQRGIDPGTGSARDRAQSVDRAALQQKAPARPQNPDRDATRERAQQASRDHALQGAGDRQARQQIDRGAASQKAALRPDAAGARPTATGGGNRAAAAGGGNRAAAAGGGARASTAQAGPRAGGGGGARVGAGARGR